MEEMGLQITSSWPVLSSGKNKETTDPCGHERLPLIYSTQHQLCSIRPYFNDNSGSFLNWRLNSRLIIICLRRLCTGTFISLRCWCHGYGLAGLNRLSGFAVTRLASVALKAKSRHVIGIKLFSHVGMIVLLNWKGISSTPWQLECSVNDGRVAGIKKKKNAIVAQKHYYGPLAVMAEKCFLTAASNISQTWRLIF